MNKHVAGIFFAILFASVVGCNSSQKPKRLQRGYAPIPELSFSIVREWPHSTQAFTEGLLFHDGQLFESTGILRNAPEFNSMIATHDLKTGNLKPQNQLDPATYFGEGMVILNNRVYQLTYKHQLCFTYSYPDFKPLGTFSFPSKEGWGLTTNGQDLIMSDGTDTLSFIDPIHHHITKKLAVRSNGYAVDHLNELEYVNGFIFANVWPKNTIVKINAHTGKVVGQMDVTPLFTIAKEKNAPIDVCNGIAYHAETGHLWVTGKMWPIVFELSVDHSLHQ